MNINTKAILASILLAALFSGTSAFAEDRDNLFAWELNAAATEMVETSKVTYQAPSLVDYEAVKSGRL